MIWSGFSKKRVNIKDIEQAELARKNRDADNADKLKALQKELAKALAELGPRQKAEERD